MNRALSIAATSAVIAAGIELPLSQLYRTIPATAVPKRMLIASGMAFVSTLVASWLFLRSRR